MSAVAHAIEEKAAHALHVVADTAHTAADLAAKEAFRWMAWFGLPMLGASIFVAAAIATGALWMVGGALFFLIAAICLLIWLCLSTCTNGVDCAPAVSH